MKKRIAYIGLSYPIMFDTTSRTKSWLNPGTPINKYPIIDSSWGLMLLYDELWFLCRDVCPFNMRDCQFVKYVTELYPNINYQEIFDSARTAQIKPQCRLLTNQEFFQNYVSKTNYNSYVIIAPTEYCHLGNMPVVAGALPENALFDILLKEELERISSMEIEMIANGNTQVDNYIMGKKELELASTLILNGIPNYMTRYGPYHPVIDELRENKNLKDYRQWIFEDHCHLQDSEMAEIKASVEDTLRVIQEEIMLKYFDEHSEDSFYSSTAKTVIYTAIGSVIAPFSIGAAAKDIYDERKKVEETKKDRWAAFTIEARRVIRKL